MSLRWTDYDCAQVYKNYVTSSKAVRNTQTQNYVTTFSFGHVLGKRSLRLARRAQYMLS
jgi:hypothetical protein